MTLIKGCLRCAFLLLGILIIVRVTAHDYTLSVFCVVAGANIAPIVFVSHLPLLELCQRQC